MDNLSDDIIKYKKGLLSAKEMHALEKKALEDPFLAEALEGSDLIDSTDYEKDVDQLNSKITDKEKIRFTPLRIAAGLILIASSVFLVYQLAPRKETIALKTETTTQQSPIEHNAEKKPADIQTKENKDVSTQPKNEVVAEKPTKRKVANEPKKEAETESEIEKPSHDELALTKAEEVKPKPEAQEASRAVSAPTIKSTPNYSMTDKSENKIARVLHYSNQGAGLANQATNRTITGIVVSSEDNSVLPGVNVMVKGTTIGSVTDAVGHFSIPTDEKNTVLVFSFIGHQAKEIDTRTGNSLVVKLEKDDTQLSEVVVADQLLKKESKTLDNGVPSPAKKQIKSNTKIISGVVLSSEDNSVLPGVNVVVKGTTTGTVTNASGRFSISIDQHNRVLGFFFMGYRSKEIDIKEQDSLVVKLRHDKN
ncbi:MAG: carboxypeptidase-like regulatory domain-containing protein [Bacteroidetes bacterium]|nr:carboxypeptidase-like regulatory domain-containing protein [Bacteroidota bacterium]